MDTRTTADADRSIAAFEVIATAPLQLAIRARSGRTFKVWLEPLVLNVIEHHQDDGDDDKPLFSVALAEGSVMGGDPDSALPDGEG